MCRMRIDPKPNAGTVLAEITSIENCARNPIQHVMPMATLAQARLDQIVAGSLPTDLTNDWLRRCAETIFDQRKNRTIAKRLDELRWTVPPTPL